MTAQYMYYSGIARWQCSTTESAVGNWKALRICLSLLRLFYLHCTKGPFVEPGTLSTMQWPDASLGIYLYYLAKCAILIYYVHVLPTIIVRCPTWNVPWDLLYLYSLAKCAILIYITVRSFQRPTSCSTYDSTYDVPTYREYACWSFSAKLTIWSAGRVARLQEVKSFNDYRVYAMYRIR